MNMSMVGRLGKMLGLALLAAGLMAFVPRLPAQELTVGTGGVKGIYYPLGRGICDLARRAQGITCWVESTAGSIYNLNALRSGELELGIVQSDAQHYAYHGHALFEAPGPHEELRTLFSVHTEPFTVVARRDAGIRSLDDLKGKRINIGNPGSGQRFTMEALMAAKGWTRDDFALATELESAVQARALCDNKVDTIAFTVGHPNESIEEATRNCDSVIITITGSEVDKLISDSPYYVRATVPGGIYRGNPEDVQSFGVKATLVSTTHIPEEAIYGVVKAVFDNFNAFRRIHSSFRNLAKEAMVSEGISAPLHEGAERYYREAGLLE